MAVIQIGVTTGGNKKEYQALTTDAVATFPKDCGAGSTLITIDPVLKKLSKGYYFDGTEWIDLPRLEFSGIDEEARAQIANILQQLESLEFSGIDDEARAQISDIANQKGEPLGFATLDETGKVPLEQLPEGTGAITKEDIVALGIPAQDTVTTVNGKTGAISKADIVALGIPAQDTVYTHPASHSMSEIEGLQTLATKVNAAPIFIRVDDWPTEEDEDEENKIYYKVVLGSEDPGGEDPEDPEEPEDLEEPIELPTDDFLHFDASELELSDNAAVSSWPDLSTNGYDAAQSDPTKQPTYKATGLNGHPSVYFDGTEHLINTELSLPAKEDCTIVAVFKLENIATSQCIVGLGGATVSDLTTYLRYSGSLGELQFYGRQVTPPGVPCDTTAMVFVGTHDAVNDVLYKNGAMVKSQPVEDSFKAADRVTIGMRPYTGDNANAHVAVFRYFTRVLTEQEIQAISAYYMSKWGIV